MSFSVSHDLIVTLHCCVFYWFNLLSDFAKFVIR